MNESILKFDEWFYKKHYEDYLHFWNEFNKGRLNK